MAIEPIKGFYVHDEETDTDGIAKYDAGALENLDRSLTERYRAPDSKAVGDRLSAVEAVADEANQTAERLNEGGLELKDEVLAENISAWLNEHPEATTTVEDGALTQSKLSNSLDARKPSFYSTVSEMQEDEQYRLGATAISDGAVYTVRSAVEVNDPEDMVGPSVLYKYDGQYYHGGLTESDREIAMGYECVNGFALFVTEFKNAYVTPEQFGAVGDGLTDDLRPINQCLAAAKAQNKVVLFGNVYAVSATVSIPRSVNILGYGYQYSGIKLIVAADAVLLCGGYSTIEGVTIDGNNMATYAVNISSPYTNIEKCLIKGGDKSAIVFRTTYCNVIHNNRIYGGEYAVICNFNELTSVARHNATTISDNNIINASKYALVIGGGDSWRIVNNTIELCRLGVAVFTGFHNLEFTGNYLENNGNYSSVFTMTNKTFYIRPIIVFNSFNDGNMTLAAGTVGQSAVVSNNFVNMSDVASDNTIPSNYSDLSTFILASGVEDLTINNNTCVSSGNKSLIMYGSRSANTTFNNCHALNNKGFDNIKQLGGNYTGLTVAPDIYADDVVQYNYFSGYDFSDFTGLTFTDTNASLYGNIIYSCDVSNTYGNFYASYNILKPLKGKTAIIGFWANVPEGVTIGFYSNAGIPFNEECIIRNRTFNEWTFIGMSLEVPETFSTDFRFYVQMHGITSTPIQVAGLFFAEIGTPKNSNIK